MKVKGDAKTSFKMAVKAKKKAPRMLSCSKQVALISKHY